MRRGGVRACPCGWLVLFGTGSYCVALASPFQLLGLKVGLLSPGFSVAGPGEDGRGRAVSELC